MEKKLLKFTLPVTNVFFPSTFSISMIAKTIDPNGIDFL